MEQQLINHALASRDLAYSPYSQFKVGAALTTKENVVYTGCNIENAAFPVSCCAERVAIFKAVSAGEKSFKEMAVIADTRRPVSPCGSCRQVMAEFFERNMQIHLSNLKGEIKTVTVEQLLPYSFQATDLTAE